MDARPIKTAELFAIGTELTTGETRDSNGGELAASLAAAGVSVRRVVALPDDLDLVTSHFREALTAADLVVVTGGLGPTPDDLTREALAAAVGEVPAVDPEVEAWLRALFARRGTRMPDPTLKQAWLIPSAKPIRNDNGTAPGWWVEAPNGGVAVLLPGPPREMRPMWTDWALPRLRERGLGDGRVVRTLRTYGIGESVVVERLGEAVLRRTNPVIATYAKPDWLDIRISAVPEGGGGRGAQAILDEAVAFVRDSLAGHVWAEGEMTWADVVAGALEKGALRLATLEAGTRSQLAWLLADVPQLVETRGIALPTEADTETGLIRGLEDMASEAAASAGAGVGLAVVAIEDGPHTRVVAAVASPEQGWTRRLELPLFQRGAQGRLRAAVAGAAFLVEMLRERPQPGSHETIRR